MAHLAWLWLKNQRYWVRIPAGSDIFYRDCAFTVFQTVQKPGVVLCAVYGTVHYKGPLESFDKSKA